MRDAKRDVIDTGIGKSLVSTRRVGAGEKMAIVFFTSAMWINAFKVSWCQEIIAIQVATLPGQFRRKLRRVPNKRREEFKTQQFHGPNVNMSEVKTLQGKIEDKLKMLKITAEDTKKYLRSKM